MRTLALLLPLAAMAFASVPASAREVDRQEVDEQFMQHLPQERKLYCLETKAFTMTDGSERSACVNWRAQVRTRSVRTYAALNGPEEDSSENIGVAKNCFALAVASQNAPDRATFNKDSFLAGARTEFAASALANAMQNTDAYRIRTYRKRFWLGGR
ncbi:MAG: hypothetical protein ABJP34_07325 [Erythrobacter sp.]